MLILLVHETNAEYLTLTWLGCRDTLKNRRKKEGDKGYPPPILTNNKNILRTKANAIFFLFCEAINNLCCFTAQLWNAHLLSWHPLNIHTNPPPKCDNYRKVLGHLTMHKCWARRQESVPETNIFTLWWMACCGDETGATNECEIWRGLVVTGQTLHTAHQNVNPDL